MSFLDNLENDLKALENREEKDPEKVRRDRDRCGQDRGVATGAARRSPASFQPIVVARVPLHQFPKSAPPWAPFMDLLDVLLPRSPQLYFCFCILTLAHFGHFHFRCLW
jgi:hypothetical protein